MSVVAITTGTTTANVSWTPPDPSLQNGVIIYYTVILTDLMFGMPECVYNTTITSFSFMGLEEYARYECEVAAATIGGLGPFSTSVRFTTFEDGKNEIIPEITTSIIFGAIPIVPTAPPQNLSGSALSSTVIMLIWSLPPPVEVNGAIQHYTVIIVERHTGRQWTFLPVDQQLHVGSLHPYYYYDFNVSATTVGRGPFTTIHSIQTLPESKHRC